MSRHGRRTGALALVILASTASAATAADCSGQRWTGAWTAAPTDAGPGFAGQTLRLVLTPLHGGRWARVRLSNRFGTRSVTFTRTWLGRQAAAARLVAGSNRAVRFRGRRSVTVRPGREVLSDPVALRFAAFAPLAVSVYVAGPTGPATRHFQARQTSYATRAHRGDRSGRTSGAAYSTALTTRPFVTELRTRAPRSVGSVVALGDSITDGDPGVTHPAPAGFDRDVRYPDFLARRLGPRFTVLNQGIGGNRVRRDGLVPTFGPSLLHRLGPDVLSRTDVTDVVLLEGINDVAQAPSPSAGALIAAIRRVVGRLRERGLNVLVGTLTPSRGPLPLLGRYASRRTGATRAGVNRWIRTSGIGDGVVDFDRALRDPARHDRLARRFDSGDGLHPSPAGYRRMAQAIDPADLRGTGCRR